jgi:hypothetical protein
MQEQFSAKKKATEEVAKIATVSQGGAIRWIEGVCSG